MQTHVQKTTNSIHLRTPKANRAPRSGLRARARRCKACSPRDNHRHATEPQQRDEGEAKKQKQKHKQKVALKEGYVFGERLQIQQIADVQTQLGRQLENLSDANISDRRTHTHTNEVRNNKEHANKQTNAQTQTFGIRAEVIVESVSAIKPRQRKLSANVEC